MSIDRKYQIFAINPCSKNIHTDKDAILFLAKDKALPAALKTYLKESKRLGANPAHLASIELLIERVKIYQQTEKSELPDTDLPCEIERCVNGVGI